jgi:two-component sensor histidine kinase
VKESLTWKKADQDESELSDYLVRALIRSGVCVTLQDADLGYVFIANLPDCWSVEAERDPDDSTIFGAGSGAEIAALKREAMGAGEKRRTEISPGDELFFEIHAEPIRAADGSVSVMTTIIDLTEERRRERILRALLRELSHRSKNLLAIIQSIANQTARFAPDLEFFKRKFFGRLHSLSQSQDLITDSSWRGARFYDLAEQQIEKYLPEVPGSVSVTGENLWLNPNEALHVGLALHELVVNAAGAGTMRAGGAPIEISCVSIRKKNECPQVAVTWSENRKGLTLSDDAIADQSVFGSIVLQRVVPNAVGGEAEYSYDDDRVCYSLKFQQRAED